MKKKLVLLTIPLLVLVGLILVSVDPDRRPESNTESKTGNLSSSQTAGKDASTNSVTLTNPGLVNPVEPIASQKIAFAEPIRNLTRLFNDDGPLQPVIVELDVLGKLYKINLEKMVKFESDDESGAFLGRVEGEPHSRVTWGYSNDAETGEIWIPNQPVVKIVSTGAGSGHATKWKLSDLGKCGTE